jgi:uncharacterized protein YjiK
MPKILLLSLVLPWLYFPKLAAPVYFSGAAPFPFQLDAPDITLEMPAELREISGLGFTADFQQMAALNDEQGIIYFFDKKTGEIKSSVPFRESGDYEGVEIVGNDAWAMKSNGTLYQIHDFAKPSPSVEKYKSFLNSDNDVEGLAYDPKNNRLLIGCKGKGFDREGTPLNKAIYAFDLATKTVADTPAFLLTLPDLDDFIVNSGQFDPAEKLERIITAERTEIRFSPSGIAIHPKTGDVYVTSARGNSLLVLNEKGKILHIEHLKKSLHTQPEGICFDADGTLYIANEGGDGKPGMVLGFYPK